MSPVAACGERRESDWDVGRDDWDRGVIWGYGGVTQCLYLCLSVLRVAAGHVVRRVDVALKWELSLAGELRDYKEVSEQFLGAIVFLVT
jgi:hypothetical protein